MRVQMRLKPLRLSATSSIMTRLPLAALTNALFAAVMLTVSRSLSQCVAPPASSACWLDTSDANAEQSSPGGRSLPGRRELMETAAAKRSPAIAKLSPIARNEVAWLIKSSVGVEARGVRRDFRKLSIMTI